MRLRDPIARREGTAIAFPRKHLAVVLLAIVLVVCPILTLLHATQPPQSDDPLDPWRKATVMLGVVVGPDSAKTFQPIGAGLLVYNYAGGQGAPPLILTAKHVIEGLRAIQVRLLSDRPRSLREDLGFLVPLLQGDIPIYIAHPDSRVDLVVFPFAPVEVGPGAEVGASPLTIPKSAMLESAALRQGDVVGILGYPGNLGEVGQAYRTRPLYRQGVVAWVPSPGATDGSGVLVDVSAFAGTSGGPALLVQRPFGGIRYPAVALFIGVVTDFVPEVIRASDRQGYYQSVIVQNAGLTVIVPAERVFELIEHVEAVVH